MMALDPRKGNLQGASKEESFDREAKPAGQNVQPQKKEPPKGGDIPEPVTQEALDAGRVQANPNTEGMSLEDEQKLADEQKKQQEEQKTFLKSIIDSNEGYVLRDESNAENVDKMALDQVVYVNNVQSGPAGSEVEERVYLTDKGYSQTR